MALIETEGLILKSYSLAEADKIIILLTQHQGVIRGVAKGAKRLKSRFGGSLEPFTIVQIQYNQKDERELVSIRQIDLVKSFFSEASNPNFLQKFAYLIELLIEFSPPHDPNENLYRMTKVCLETAAADPESLESLTVYFELWLLRLGGYLPNWNKCDQCRKDLNSHKKASLQINFHLLCFDCRKTQTNWIISASQRQIFNSAQKLSPVNFVEFANKNTSDLKEISTILKRIISNIIGREVTEQKILFAGS